MFNNFWTRPHFKEFQWVNLVARRRRDVLIRVRRKRLNRVGDVRLSARILSSCGI